MDENALLASLIAPVVHGGYSPHVIADQLLKKFGSLSEVLAAHPLELKQVAGVGDKIASAIKAAKSVVDAFVYSTQVKEGRTEVTIPEVAARLIRSLVKDGRVESFVCILLDSRKRYMTHHVVSTGTLDTALASPGEVFRLAVKSHAAAMVVGHNHPSGDPTPSDDDVRLTRRLVEAGKIMGISVVDHVIVGDQAHYIFRGHALL